MCVHTIYYTGVKRKKQKHVFISGIKLILSAAAVYKVYKLDFLFCLQYMMRV